MDTHMYSSLQYQQLTGTKTYFAHELTIILVLKGQVQLADKTQQLTLLPGELYSLNLNQLVTLSANQSILLFLQLDSVFFASQFPNFFNRSFDCSPQLAQQGKQAALLELRKHIAELALNEFNQNEEQALHYTISLSKIILILTQQFQIEQAAPLYTGNYKLRQILEYLEAHYAENLSLHKVAEHFYLSESVLSKFFKKETGEFFSDYLKKLQIRHSIPELLYAKKSIEEVAADHGFNSSKIYREQFKKIFDSSPTEYRAKQLETSDLPKENEPLEHKLPKAITQKELLVWLYRFVQVTDDDIAPPHLATHHKHLKVEVLKPGLEKKPAVIIIHVGTLAELNDQQVQLEIKQLKQHNLIHFISFYQLFPTDLTDYYLAKHAQLNSYPPFETLDNALTFIQAQQLKILFHIPLDAELVQDIQLTALYRQFFHHIQNQFSLTLLAAWQINLQFKTTALEEQASLFKQLHHEFKQISPLIKIGVQLPLADPYQTADLFQIVQTFQQSFSSDCDFVTFTAEPNFIFKTPDLNQNVQGQHQYIQQKTHSLIKAFKTFNLNLPLYLVEWNTLTGTTISTNGLFFRGAILSADLLALSQLIAGFGFWLDIKNYEANKKESRLTSEGLELFHYFAAKRPAYFCLALTQRQTGTILAQGEAYLLTKQENNYQLLVWNTNYFDPHLSSEEAFLASQSLDLELDISGLIPGKYQIKQLELSRDHGALFYTYNAFSNANQLDWETHHYINALTRPRLKVFDTAITETFTYYLTLDTNAVVLLELKALR